MCDRFGGGCCSVDVGYFDGMVVYFVFMLFFVYVMFIGGELCIIVG